MVTIVQIRIVKEAEDHVIRRKVIAAEDAERRLRRELKDYTPDYRSLEGLLAAGLKQRIISETEAQLIRDADAARTEVIKVDDFAADMT